MRLKDHILSDENIYLAIYSVKSYVFDPQLLDLDDAKLLNELADPFNEDVIKGLIEKVKSIVTRIITKKECLFETQVYFKPKEYTKDKEKIYRPIHTAKLEQLIAMVAILHALIYEMPDDEKDKKLNLSNYSRLIPNNFYGNRVSNKPEELFKRWNKQYKKYTQKANDYFKTFRETKEYKYELKLDLKNFFPSINPLITYGMLMENVPVTLSDKKDVELLKTIINKLLVCKVTNLNTDLAKQHYYGSVIDGVCCTKGIAQGLPQSYFFGNITMIQIAKIFDAKYEGKAVYYVDDSYIYTNKATEDENQFIEQLEDINREIKKAENKYLSIGLKDTKSNRKNSKLFWGSAIGISMGYGISVHTRDKSSCVEIQKTKEGEMYLRTLSREASQIGSDMMSTYSEEEELAMLYRTSALLQTIKFEKEIAIEKNDKNYQDKLERYYKFFGYREIKLKLKTRSEKDNQIFSVLLHNELQSSKDNLYEALQSAEINEKKFFYDYKHDIWQTAISLLISNTIYEYEHASIRIYINNIIKKSYEKDLIQCSYIWKIFHLYLNKITINNTPNPYATLEKNVNRKMVRYSNMNKESLGDEFNYAVLKGLHEEVIKSFDVCDPQFVQKTVFVCENSNRLQRMFLNAVYSKIFKVSLSDDIVINSYDKKNITYGALRVLVYLRNNGFDMDKFWKWDLELMSPENMQKVDYTLFEVLGAYKKYVATPENIDDLILVHKYTCDVWKNGAKHLYFYTLHNQEHAVDLIKNIIKIVKVFSYFKISNYDYYILFIACYLHDISMVRIASENEFLLDNDTSEIITSEIDKEWSKVNGASDIKRAIIKTYKKVDGFFEDKVRKRHAEDSAEEIRKRADLNFLETSVRECVAEVAESHTKDTRDIYFVKGDAKNRLISYKFDEILLRFADLLDMSEHRVSKPILSHNLDNMSLDSAFHWVSHLLTDGYKILTQYNENKKNEKSNLTPGSIKETITLLIYVNLSQFSKMPSRECTCGRLDEVDISQKGLTINLLGDNEKCACEQCNFLCQWFNEKNYYLVKEMQALEAYLSRIPMAERFYDTKIKINVVVNNPTSISDEQFEILKEKVSRKNENGKL